MTWDKKSPLISIKGNNCVKGYPTTGGDGGGGAGSGWSRGLGT